MVQTTHFDPETDVMTANQETYQGLDVIDRHSAESLRAYFQANQTSSGNANRLTNLCAWQSFLMAATLALTDYLILLLTFSISDRLSKAILYESNMQQDQRTLLIAALLIVPIAHTAGLYPGIGQGTAMEFRQALRALIAAIATFIGIGVFLFPGNLLFYTIFGCIAFGTVPILLPIRFFVRKLGKYCRFWGVSTLIVAEPERGVELFRKVAKSIDRGFRPIGVLLPPEHYWSGSELLEKHGITAFDLRSTSEVATKYGVTWAIVSPCVNREYSPASDPIFAAIPNRILLSSKSLDMGLWDEVFCVGSTTGIRLGGIRPSDFQLACKRLLDITLTSLGLLITAPMLLFVCFLIKLSSRGPIFYGQTRIGKDGKEFTAWKFRSMVQNADAVLESYLEQNPEARTEWKLKHKLANDPRVTGIGDFLRRTSLDELPQLWNVMIGEMSLVGPRPIVNSPTYDAAYVNDYPDEYDVYKSVRPGLTGVWQVSSRSNGVYELRVYWDMYYIRNWSIWLDLYLIFRTFKTVMFREGAA